MKLPFPPLTLDACPWALRPELLPRVLKASRMALDPAQLLSGPELAKSEPQTARHPMAASSGGSTSGPVIAVIPLCGVLTPRGSFLSYLFGGGSGSLQSFRDEFADAVASPDVGAIIIDIDSPGGQTALTPETAADVAAAAGTKPIIAIANVQACSGAYFIGSQADEFVISPSGYVGSIGVYMHHEDWSAFETELGVKHTFVVADGSPYKVEGNEFEPLNEHAESEWQDEVNTLMAMFVTAVAEGRGVSEDTVLSDFGQGSILLAEQAVAVGMADRVATLEDVIADLITINAPGGGGASALATRVENARRRAEAARSTPRAGDDPDEPADEPEEEPPTGEPADEPEPPEEPAEPEEEPEEPEGDEPDGDPEAEPEAEEEGETDDGDDDVDAALELA